MFLVGYLASSLFWNTLSYNIEQRTVYSAHQIQYFRKFCIFEPKLGPTSQYHLDSLKQSSEEGEEEDHRKWDIREWTEFRIASCHNSRNNTFTLAEDSYVIFNKIHS